MKGKNGGTMKKKAVLFVASFCTILLFWAGWQGNLQGQEVSDYDYLIRNARILDGTLKPAFKADIAVKDGIIVKIQKSLRGNANWGKLFGAEPPRSIF